MAKEDLNLIYNKDEDSFLVVEKIEFSKKSLFCAYTKNGVSWTVKDIDGEIICHINMTDLLPHDFINQYINALEDYEAATRKLQKLQDFFSPQLFHDVK